MPQFERYLGIDYSGAETPASSLKGLRLYEATTLQPPIEISPPPSPRNWTRRGLAEWLAAELRDGPPPSSASITHFPFLCATSKLTTFCSTGPRSSTTSSTDRRRAHVCGFHPGRPAWPRGRAHR